MKKSLNNYINSLVNKIINETIEEKADELVTKLTEGDKMVCEQCGNMMTEGICEQCSGSDMKEGEEFDYVAEEEEFGSDPLGLVDRFCKTDSKDYNKATCDYHEARFMGGGEVSEKLYGRQSRIDVAEPKGKITGADFKKLKSMKKETDEEMEEGNAFTGALSKAKKEGDKSFEVGGKKFDVRESKKSIQMTESEMINFIDKNTAYRRQEIIDKINSGERDLEDFYLDIVDTVARKKQLGF
jgi:hypothetical protein